MIARIINIAETSRRIELMMVRAGISPNDVHMALNISVQAVYKWCNPEQMTIISREHIVMLAYMCKCRIEDLLICEDLIYENNSMYTRPSPPSKNDIYRDFKNVWGSERDALSTEQLIENLQKHKIFIDIAKTSDQIKKMITETEFDFNYIQTIMQLGSTRTIYRWIDKADARLPSLENLVSLAGICGCEIDDLLVYKCS